MFRLLQKLPVQLLLIIPVIFYLTVALYWHARDLYSLTGDEPHYLLIADSIVRDHDLRVENNYEIDTPVQRSMKLKLNEPELMPVHVRNQFSLHNIGLPLLLALPYALAGVLGAKIFMALLAGLWPLLFYRILLQITESKTWSAIVAFALAIGLPFSDGSSRIVTDLLGGLIVLYLAWRISVRFEDQEKRPLSFKSLLWFGALIAFLPWLHIKLIAPAIFLLLALIYTEAKRDHVQTSVRLPRYLIPLAMFVCSSLLIAIYNDVAYGSIFGPYDRGSSSRIVKEIVMIFFGLHWDQAQGMFMQQPLLLVGLVGIASLVKANWRASLLFALIYLSVLLPNSTHTAWYGGYSFAGRFHWTVAPLWVFPLAYTVKSLLKENRLALMLLVTASIALQVWLAMKWVFQDGFLVIQKVPVWASHSFYDDTGLLFELPSFKDFDIYLRDPANYLFVALGLLLVVTGWLWQRGKKRLLSNLWIAFAVFGLSALMLLPAPAGSLTYKPHELPRQIGNNDGLVRVATEKDGAGMLIFGPYVQLIAGLYEVSVEYESSDTREPVVGHFDVVYSPGVRLVSEADLPSADMNDGLFKYRFPVRDEQSLDAHFEFRIWYAGRGTLRIKSMTLAPVSFDQ